MRGAVETKVAAGTSAGAVVALVFGLAAWQHWFTPPPPDLTALVVSVVSGLAGWLAPHTSRTPPVITPVSSPPPGTPPLKGP